MEIFEFDQYSEPWWKIREKKLTASKAQAISANGAGLKTYVREIMRPLYSRAEKKVFVNKDTERGLVLEPQAIMAYSLDRLIQVKKVGFVLYNEYVGCSPDGFADEGLVEIKCPDDKVYMDLLLDGKIDTGYEWQCQMQMLIRGVIM